MKRLRTMEEVEDATNLANCLRLLSKPDQTTAHRDFECKTCHRQFPSFQALGGHRASHKKPQLVHNKQTQGPASSVREHSVIRDIELAFSYFGGSRTTNTGSTPMTLDATDMALLFGKTDQTTAPQVFECKTCNRQFRSFQALGGHRVSHKKPQLVHNKQTQGPVSSVREHRGIRDIELGLPNFGGSSNTGSTPMGPASSVREHRGIRDIELPFSYFGGSRTTNTGSTPMREGGKHDQDPKMKDFRNFTYWITTLFITILVGLLSVNERQPELLFRSCSSLAIGATICCIAMLMLILIRPSSQRPLTCLKMMQYLTVGLLFVAAVLVFTLL